MCSFISTEHAPQVPPEARLGRGTCHHCGGVVVEATQATEAIEAGGDAEAAIGLTVDHVGGNIIDPVVVVVVAVMMVVVVRVAVIPLVSRGIVDCGIHVHVHIGIGVCVHFS